jgi:CRP/FNR family transcriptional regulator, cyclic AMP receptor protein
MQKVLFILGELSDDDIDWLVDTASREEVAAGTVLIQEGQPIDALYIVLDGTLRVSIEELADKEIAELGRGEVVGEMSFVDARPPSATVKALQNSVLLSIPRQQLAIKLHQDVGFASRFYRALAIFLSDRLRGTVSRLGYGREAQFEGVMERGNEPNPNVLDNLTLAAARFDWLLRRLRGAGHH